MAWASSLLPARGRALPAPPAPDTRTATWILSCDASSDGRNLMRDVAGRPGLRAPLCNNRATHRRPHLLDQQHRALADEADPVTQAPQAGDRPVRLERRRRENDQVDGRPTHV